MTRKLTALTLALALTLPGTGAFASEGHRVDEATAQQIRAMLTEQGYEVRKIQAEDGQYEAYALKDGKRMEVYLNAALEIVRTSVED